MYSGGLGYDQLVKRQVRDGTPQPGILLLQLLQPLQLIPDHAAVRTTPPIVRLLRDPDPAHRLRNTHALTLQNCNLPQLHDNVFRFLSLPSHLLVVQSAGQIYPSCRTTSAGTLHLASETDAPVDPRAQAA